MRYRPDINGLRSLAVVPVILFHAGLSGFSGGFVGVDVFFVISGFLITGILARELRDGTFSILRFYERRARRILPALFAVLAVTSLAATVIMLPYELETYGQGLIGVLLFVSNIVFWQQSGYFAASSELNPLLHTWSLAVEEQFYIIFPLLLWALWRWRLRAIWIAIAVIALGSLALSEVASTRAASANFFLLPTRAWELMVGALAALWLMRRAQPTGGVAEVMGLGGMVAWKPFVAIGLVSYSAYLWHQPLFAFARLLDADNHPSTLLMVALSVLSVLLAAVSWRWVEQPFRSRDGFGQGAIFAMSGLGGAVLAGFGALVIMSGGLLQRYPATEQNWVERGPRAYGDYVKAAHLRIRNVPLSTDTPNVVIVGDSFSEDFVNVLNEGSAFTDYTLSALYIPARCQLQFGEDYAAVRDFVQPADRRFCATRSLTEHHAEVMRGADIVILAARWQDWAAARLPATIDALALPETTRLIVVGPKSFERNRRAILIAGRSEGAAARVTPSENALRVNAMLRDSLPGDV